MSDYKNYDSMERFNSYYYQITQILKLNPKKVLEIGIGNKVLANYLKNQGVKVKTMDLDESLKPDIICDIRNVDLKERFDVIACFEILEHISYDDALKAINKLLKHTDTLIISVPKSFIGLNIAIKIPLIKYFNISLELPYNKFLKGSNHYWELGSGVSKKSFFNDLNKYFIVDSFSPLINRYHQFIVLKNKKKQIWR